MFLYVATDGDHIGRKVGQLSLADDEEGLRRVSQAIDNGNKIFASWVNSSLGEMISYGGDESRFKVPADKLDGLDAIRRQYEGAVGSTVSVGVGIRLSEADRALMCAKLRGGDRIVLYTPEIEEELAQVQEKTEAQKLGDEYFTQKSEPLPDADARAYAQFRRNMFNPLYKADPPEPESTAKENKGNAGGGYTGFHEAGIGGEPQAPMQEASEHSEGEAAQAQADQQSSAETTHSSKDFEDQLHGHAQEQDKKDGGEDQELDQLSQAKQQVIQILQQVRQQAPAMEQVQQQNPELYAAMQGVVQALLITAHALIDGNPDQQQQQDGQQMQKAEPGTPTLTAPPPEVRAPAAATPALHNTVAGFMGGLKALPKTASVRGRFITQHMNHAPFLSALQAHPQGVRIHAQLTSFMNGAANAGFRPGATKTVVKAETSTCKHFYGKGRRCLKCKAEKSEDLDKAQLPMPHATVPKLHLPVGSTKDGKIKVQHEDGHSSWVSVRSGMVLSNDGHAVSSRNPSGK